MSTKKQISARDYLKVIEWSEEDGCYIGSAPPLIGRCCHGVDKRPLPAPIKGREYSGKFVV